MTIPKMLMKRVKKRIKGLIWQVKHGKITKESAIGSIESTKGWIKWRLKKKGKNSITYSSEANCSVNFIYQDRYLGISKEGGYFVFYS